MQLPGYKEAIDYFSNRGEKVIAYEKTNTCVTVITQSRTVSKTCTGFVTIIWEYRNPWRTDSDKYARWYEQETECSIEKH